MARGDRNAERMERSEVRRRVAELIDELSLLPRPDYADPESMAERCRLHRTRCMEMDLMPTVGTLAVALGVSIAQMQSLADARSNGWYGRRLSAESADVLQKELFMLECSFNSNFENGAYANPVTGIFAAKNLYGWKDTRETHEVVAHVEITPDQIAERYHAAIPMHVDPQGEVHMLQDGVRARSAARKSQKIRSRIASGDFPEACEIPPQKNPAN